MRRLPRLPWRHGILRPLKFEADHPRGGVAFGQFLERFHMGRRPGLAMIFRGGFALFLLPPDAIAISDMVIEIAAFRVGAA